MKQYEVRISDGNRLEVFGEFIGYDDALSEAKKLAQLKQYSEVLIVDLTNGTEERIS